MSEHKTLFAVRIERKTARELFWLSLILGGLFGVIGIIGLIKVVACKYDDPLVTVKACLLNERPRQ